MEVLAIVMAETLSSGSCLIESIGLHIGIDMADYWVADDAFYGLIRDREVLTEILREVGGETVAQAHATEKGKTIKGVINDFLTGENGRAKREHWIPRWMAFPPTAYTERGGVATVASANRVRWQAEAEGLRSPPRKRPQRCRNPVTTPTKQRKCRPRPNPSGWQRDCFGMASNRRPIFSISRAHARSAAISILPLLSYHPWRSHKAPPGRTGRGMGAGSVAVWWRRCQTDSSTWQSPSANRLAKFGAWRAVLPDRASRGLRCHF